jgi:S1-C subfamily serine protease
VKVIGAGILLICCFAAQSSDTPAEKIAKEHQEKIVMLSGLDSGGRPLTLGTGFFIGSNGAVATNARVVEGASKVLVSWRGESGTANRVLRFDPKYDLVVLQISYNSTPVVPMRDSDTATVGEAVVVLGTAYGFGGAISTSTFLGILSSVRNINNARYLT